MNSSELLYGNHSKRKSITAERIWRYSAGSHSIGNVVDFFSSPFPPPLLFTNLFSHTLESGPKNPTGVQTHLAIRICHDAVRYPHLRTPLI